ncbi:MAG: hypothetical protein ACJ8F7_01315 [Gemmataceae bacterium]
MRATIGLSLASLLIVTATASAQYPYQGSGGYGGTSNPYGGASGGPYGGVPYGGSPLSPYLNLGRGTASSPAVNYYNFVRPNLPNPNRMALGGVGAMGTGARWSYFPTLQSLDDEGLPKQQRSYEKDKEGREKTKLPPTGHAVGYQNTLGYYGPMMGGSPGSAGRGPAGQPRIGR